VISRIAGRTRLTVFSMFSTFFMRRGAPRITAQYNRSGCRDVPPVVGVPFVNTGDHRARIHALSLAGSAICSNALATGRMTGHAMGYGMVPTGPSAHADVILWAD
jgi:hypothetical protein